MLWLLMVLFLKLIDPNCPFDSIFYSLLYCFSLSPSISGEAQLIKFSSEEFSILILSKKDPFLKPLLINILREG